MSTTEATTKATPAPLPAGGQVLAVVPQTVEEIQRMSNMVIAAGIAPQSLIKRVKDNATDEEQAIARQMNIAAVATAIMAGAELGLPPFVALRSFTVINGRPALYADGNVAVVRKAKGADGLPIAEYVRHGFEVGESEALTFAWCEAKRRDNGEVHREEFSIEDAKLAGLWDAEPMREREVWEYNQAERKRVPIKRMMPNDTPWHRFPKRMMMWRATGYCLRWLFADVLGGMPDEYEARDIEGLIDITPAAPQQATRPSPPPVPEEDDGPAAEEPKQPDPPPAPKPSRARKPKPEAAPAATATPTPTTGQPTSSTGLSTATSSDQSEAQPLTSSTAPETTVVENTATGEPMTVDAGTGQVLDDEEDDPLPPPATTAQQQALAEVEAKGDPGVPEAGSEEWWESLEQWAALAGDKDALDEVFGSGDEGFDVYASLSGDEQATKDATELYDRELARITANQEHKQLEADGQSNFLDDLPDETQEAYRLGNTP